MMRKDNKLFGQMNGEGLSVESYLRRTFEWDAEKMES